MQDKPRLHKRASSNQSNQAPNFIPTHYHSPSKPALTNTLTAAEFFQDPRNATPPPSTTTSNTSLSNLSGAISAPSSTATSATSLHSSPRTSPAAGPRHTRSLQPLFGIPLPPTTQEVPNPLYIIISFLEQHVQTHNIKAYTAIGLFLSYPDYNEVQDAKIQLESGELSEHSNLANPSVMVELLRIYLKELPQPLLSFEYYEPMMSVYDSIIAAELPSEKSVRLGYLRDIFQLLPTGNQLILCYLITFFNRLIRKSEITKINALNLGNMFGPYFIRPREINADYHTAESNGLMTLIIENSTRLLQDLRVYPVALAKLKPDTRNQISITIADEAEKKSDEKIRKDAFYATIRGGKRKTPATIRTKPLEFTEDFDMAESPTTNALPIAFHISYNVEPPKANALIRSPFTIIDKELYVPHFANNIANKERGIYICLDQEFGPLILCQEKHSHGSNEPVKGTEFIAAPPGSKKMSAMIKFLRVLYPTLSPSMKFSEVNDPTISDELLKYEKKGLSKGSKFGIIYRRKGQTNEDEIFANNEILDQSFWEFLNLIGKTVELTGFDGFRGGLDVKNKTTGTLSVYTTFADTEIMFHVGPYLPWYPMDKQQIERKRHVGNDLVVIVYQEDESEFNPLWITSEMNNVFIVVTACKDGYKIGLTSKKGVKMFEPRIPDPPIISKTPVGREFFLAKIINAERAVLHAPVFEKKLARTRRLLLEKLIADSYNRRKAKMPKVSKPAEKLESARKSSGLLSGFSGRVMNNRRQSNPPEMAPLILAEVKASGPATLPSALNSSSPASMVEDGDILSLASSKQVKKYLTTKVDQLYQDEDVSRMMETDLVGEPEEADGKAEHTLLSMPPPTITNEHDKELHNISADTKKKVADLNFRFASIFEILLNQEPNPDRLILYGKVLKVCNNVLDQNIQEYSSSLFPLAKVGDKAERIENIKKGSSQITEKLNAMLSIMMKINNLAECSSLSKNIHLLSSYETYENNKSAPAKEVKMRSSTTPETLSRPASTTALGKLAPAIRRSAADLRSIKDKLGAALDKTYAKVISLYRLERDKRLDRHKVTQLIQTLQPAGLVLPENSVSTLDVAVAISKFKVEIKDIVETLEPAAIQDRFMEMTRVLKVISTETEKIIECDPVIFPDDLLKIAEEITYGCDSHLERLMAQIKSSKKLEALNRFSRILRGISKFIATQEYLTIPHSSSESSDQQLSDSQIEIMLEFTANQMQDVQAKLHATNHRIRESVNENKPTYDSLAQLELLERIHSLLTTEQLFTPRNLKNQNPIQATATGPLLEDSELNKARLTLIANIELLELADISQHRVSSTEIITRQCASLQLATAIGQLAVVLKKARDENAILPKISRAEITEEPELSDEQRWKLDSIKKLAIAAFMETRVYLLSLSSKVSSIREATELVVIAKIISLMKKATEDFVQNNSAFLRSLRKTNE